MGDDGDRVLLRTGPARLMFLHYYFFILLFLSTAGAMVLRLIPYEFLGRDLHLIGGGALGAFAILLLLFAELRRISNRYVVGENTISLRQGIVARRLQYVPYRMIERVELEQGILARIFNVGNVVVDTGEESLTMKAVKGPAKIQQMVTTRLADLPGKGLPAAPPRIR